MARRYTILICDDSEVERQRFYARQWDNFDIYGVERRGAVFIETDPIDSVDKLHQRILKMRAQGNLPDLVLLDLFYKRPLEDVEQLERAFVAELLRFKKDFLRLKRQALGYLVPGGVTVLTHIRQADGISAAELPVAVYTDKNFNFLPTEDLNVLYKLGAHTVHKDRDEDPLLQISPSAEYFKLLHAIDSNHSGPAEKDSVFISHGRSDDWMKIQLFLEKEAEFRTIELQQLASCGRSIMDKLQDAAARCSFAVIVMTGDDGSLAGPARVRENVMHEIGFFQGRLGLDRVVLVYEEGVSMPSNLGGIVYLPFVRGQIESVYGKLVRELSGVARGTTK